MEASVFVKSQAAQRTDPEASPAVQKEGTDVFTGQAVLFGIDGPAAPVEAVQPAAGPHPEIALPVAYDRSHHVVGQSVRFGIIRESSSAKLRHAFQRAQPEHPFPIDHQRIDHGGGQSVGLGEPADAGRVDTSQPFQRGHPDHTQRIDRQITSRQPQHAVFFRVAGDRAPVDQHHQRVGRCYPEAPFQVFQELIDGLFGKRCNGHPAGRSPAVQTVLGGDVELPFAIDQKVVNGMLAQRFDRTNSVIFQIREAPWRADPDRTVRSNRQRTHIRRGKSFRRAEAGEAAIRVTTAEAVAGTDPERTVGPFGQSPDEIAGQPIARSPHFEAKAIEAVEAGLRTDPYVSFPIL